MRFDQLRSAATHASAGMDVWSLLERRAGGEAGAAPFLVWHPYEGEPRTWTFRDLARDAAAVGTGLASRGVGRGDRILIHLENCPEFLISWFACASIGAVAVTTNTRSAGEELRYFADDCAAVGAITQPKFADLLSSNAPGLHWLVVTDNDAGVATSSAREFSSEFRSLFVEPDLPGRPIEPLAPVSVQYTSGTTSRPKGVVWTHANALWGARVNAVHEDLHPDDCHLTYLPLFHTNALAYSMLASLWVGARFVLVPKWSTSRFWDLSLRYGCTWLSLIGLSLRTLAESEPPEGHRYRMFGTAMCDLPFDSKYGAKTIGWWGMTETISHGIVGSPHLPDRPMSMGRPAPEYGIAVVGDDGRTAVGPGESGSLLIKGTPGLSMFSEYLNQPQLTRDSYDEWGWYRTGDLVLVHEDGYLSFVDRAKDMLKVGGENVAASEVERVLLESGLVREAAVVGRPDLKLEEVPVAFVVAHPHAQAVAESLLNACQDKLADFKVPRSIHVVQDLPRSTLGKLNKIELRRIAAGDGLPEAEARWLSDAKGDPSGEALDVSAK